MLPAGGFVALDTSLQSSVFSFIEEGIGIPWSLSSQSYDAGSSPVQPQASCLRSVTRPFWEFGLKLIYRVLLALPFVFTIPWLTQTWRDLLHWIFLHLSHFYLSLPKSPRRTLPAPSPLPLFSPLLLSPSTPRSGPWNTAFFPPYLAISNLLWILRSSVILSHSIHPVFFLTFLISCNTVRWVSSLFLWALFLLFLADEFCYP